LTNTFTPAFRISIGNTGKGRSQSARRQTTFTERLKVFLILFFGLLRSRLSLYPCVETRMRLRPDLVLIPGVAVFYPSELARISETPSLIVIEVLSLDDRRPLVRQKLQEYRAWGVPHVWLVDPHERRLFSLDENLIEKHSLAVPELDIELLPRNVFDWE
jgi:Uma2 family endonuclease